MSADTAVLHREELEKTTLGFWIYLMTDCVLFGSLFATYAVLRNETAGGESGAEIFGLGFVFVETILLLVSSLTSGLAVLAIRTGSKRFVASMLGLTFALGAGFLGMELYEFAKLVDEGNGPSTSAFLTSYFALVGTHGLHIFIGLSWIVALATWLWRRGINHTFSKRAELFSMFWHFLDIIWIFIFTVVYLFGVLSI
jgi:cytochrome o ubiquinol oxidase subunit 3